jgi:glycosyltransferase involved in cell wall biosynthesis
VSWIEAMAIKKAIVANIGWKLAMYDDGINGFWFTKEQNALCNKINELLQNASLRQEFGSAAEKGNNLVLQL